jgi:Rrf2 family protein
MRISAKGEYAVRAVLDLAQHQGQGLVPIQDVARRQGIPQRYLEQVLLVLKGAGFLVSRRGAAGGYRLARSPEEISVGEVLRAVEGSLAPPERPRARSSNGVERGLGELWQEVADAVAAVVDRTTFAVLVDRARQSRSRPVYHI